MLIEIRNNERIFLDEWGVEYTIDKDLNMIPVKTRKKRSKVRCKVCNQISCGDQCYRPRTIGF